MVLIAVVAAGGGGNGNGHRGGGGGGGPGWLVNSFNNLFLSEPYLSRPAPIPIQAHPILSHPIKADQTAVNLMLF